MSKLVRMFCNVCKKVVDAKQELMTKSQYQERLRFQCTCCNGIIKCIDRVVIEREED